MSARSLATRRLLFIGAPGVGKGTYASRVSEAVGIPHISSGDLLRAEVKAGSAIGTQVKDLIDQGKFVSNDLVMDMIEADIRRRQSQGYILDGFPRSLEQAKAVDARKGGVIAIEHVINFRQPYQVILEKVSQRRNCPSCGMVYNYAKIDVAGIKMDPLVPKVEGKCDRCGCTDAFVTRPDDVREVVEKRLKLYEEQTAPLEEYYAAQGKLHQFDVLGGAKQYLPKVLDLLNSLPSA